jgi:phosphopentomutase
LKILEFSRVTLIVLDSVGIGEMPDAPAYGDEGSNTLGNTARACGGLKLPNMGAMGLGNLTDVAGVPAVNPPAAVIGRAALAAPNKDTTSGHWEMMTCVLKTKLNTYPDGFPEDVIDAFCREAGVAGVLANKVASGTEVIAEYGDEHVKTGFPIVYTSADSVFQVAAHEESFGLERLYKVCEAARRVLAGDWEVGRVIARPFLGTSGAYKRTSNRHDYSLLPPVPTVLDRLCEKGIPVTGVGKIQDIFAARGVPKNFKTKDNADGVEMILRAMSEQSGGFIFANLVDTDMVYGHRNDWAGYGRCLEEFDAALPRITAAMKDDELLVICADHGNDPTTPSTDHSREYCPVLCWHKRLAKGADVGIRRSLADIGATVAEIFGVVPSEGDSFAAAL